MGSCAFIELEALKPADFARRIDLMTSSPAADSQGAIESLDRSLERLDQLFLWGHWTEPKYRAERDRLQAVRRELRDAHGSQVVEPKLGGLLAAWDSGDGVIRRELLATLFSDIHVSQGRVIGYTPRPDRQAQVTRLMDTISWKVSVMVGGDGLEPTTSSV